MRCRPQDEAPARPASFTKMRAQVAQSTPRIMSTRLGQGSDQPTLRKVDLRPSVIGPDLDSDHYQRVTGDAYQRGVEERLERVSFLSAADGAQACCPHGPTEAAAAGPVRQLQVTKLAKRRSNGRRRQALAALAHRHDSAPHVVTRSRAHEASDTESTCPLRSWHRADGRPRSPPRALPPTAGNAHRGRTRGRRGGLSLPFGQPAKAPAARYLEMPPPSDRPAPGQDAGEREGLSCVRLGRY